MTHFKHSVTQVEECRVAVSDCLLYLHNIIFTLHNYLWDAPSHGMTMFRGLQDLWNLHCDLYSLVFTSTAGYTIMKPLNMDEMRRGSQFQKSLPKSQSCYICAMQAINYGLRTVSNMYLIIFFLSTIIKIILSLSVFFFIESCKNYWTYLTEILHKTAQYIQE